MRSIEPNLREQTVATEERVLESAIKLFSAKGYKATSVREIIEDAGVTRPVLYYYFKNKESLYRGLIEAQFDEVCRAMDEVIASTSDCRGRLLGLALNSFQGSRQSPEIVRLLLNFFFTPMDEEIALNREALAQQRFSRIVRIVTDGIASGELVDDDAILLARGYAGMIDLHVMASVNNPSQDLSDDLAHRLVDLFLSGAARP